MPADRGGFLLAGFAVMLAAIFLVAHAAGAQFGPLTHNRSPVEYTGGHTGGSPVPGGPGTGGMTMNGASMNGMDMGGGQP